MKKRMLFVYNPRSGKGAINARLSEVVDVFVKSGYEVIIHPTQRARDAYEKVKELAAKHGQKYIDVNAPLKDANGNLKAEYTIEGLHIKPEGYRTIFADIMKYVEE